MLADVVLWWFFNQTYALIMIKPKHLTGHTQMVGRQLRLDMRLTPDERTFFTGDDAPDIEYLSPRVILNPVTPSIKKVLAAAKKTALADDDAPYDYNMPGRYQRTMTVDCDEWDQKCVFVAMHGAQIAGYALISFSISDNRTPNVGEVGADRYSDVSFDMEHLLSYVLPAYRGRGVGVDLSIVAGRFLSDMYNAIYRAMPDNLRLWSTLSADFNSRGGEKMTQQMYSDLLASYEELNENNSRPNIQVDKPGYDCGY